MGELKVTKGHNIPNMSDWELNQNTNLIADFLVDIQFKQKEFK